jgi:hypothetical protein
MKAPNPQGCPGQGTQNPQVHPDMVTASQYPDIYTTLYYAEVRVPMANIRNTLHSYPCPDVPFNYNSTPIVAYYKLSSTSVPRTMKLWKWQLQTLERARRSLLKPLECSNRWQLKPLERARSSGITARLAGKTIIRLWQYLRPAGDCILQCGVVDALGTGDPEPEVGNVRLHSLLGHCLLPGCSLHA